MTAEQIAKLKELADRWANDPPEADNEYDIAKDVMDLLPDVLEHIKAVSGERDSALKERDELSEGMARELAENLELFNKVGLNTKEDFGNDTSTAALSRKITEIMNERDAALKACAEMRDALMQVREWGKTVPGWDDSMVKRSLSSDCGKGYHHDDEWRPVVEALEKVRGFGSSDMGHQNMCDYVTEAAEEALAHAERLTGKGEAK